MIFQNSQLREVFAELALYKERLEENIIVRLAEEKQCSLDEAMDAYYRSQLALKIDEGRFGVQYLDYKVLVQILLESEPELFCA